MVVENMQPNVLDVVVFVLVVVLDVVVLVLFLLESEVVLDVVVVVEV
jgi:hypothetical protein